MPHEESYVVLCGVLALLQAFVTRAKSEWNVWLKVDDSAYGILTKAHIPALTAFITSFTGIVNDVINGIKALAVPPEVEAAAVYRFKQLLKCDGEGLAAGIPELLESRACRYALLNQLNALRTRVERMCNKLAKLELAATRDYAKHQEKFLMFCMGSHPRLGEKAHLIQQLSPELIVEIAHPKHKVSVRSIVRILKSRRMRL